MLWTSPQQVESVLQAMAEARHAEAMRIGNLIVGLRERKGWSQEELAHKVAVSVSTISRWERGLHKGYGPNVRKLAEVLEVEPAVLLPADTLVVGSQLDRIEAYVKATWQFLTADETAEEAARLLALAGDQLEAVAGSPDSQAPDQPSSPPVNGRHKRAS